MMHTRDKAPRRTYRLSICRVHGRLCGTLVSLQPARGYACADAVREHGKDRLIQDAMARDAEELAAHVATMNTGKAPGLPMPARLGREEG